jgi:uncharacterized protein (DUF2267 family)
VGSANAAQAVFRVLSRQLSGGEMAEVQASLPEHVREARIAAGEPIAVG